MKSKITWFAAWFRILGTRLVAVVFFALLLFTTHTWIENGIVDLVLESIGFVLVTLGALGRIWSSLYIAGNKTETLIMVGPYSMVRNPLYFFSLIAAVGLSLSAESLLIAAVLFAAFMLYYPFVILEEEKKLIAVHGQVFRTYAARTPRLVPNPFLYRGGGEYLVDTRRFEKSAVDTMWFFWVFGIIQLIERLHETRILPVFFKIP